MMAAMVQDDQSRRKLSCVLADDHDAVRMATRMQLDRLGWIEVVAEAHDGDAAFDAIVQARPDVAVVDVRMPGRTGFEVCEGLAALDVPTRVVLFTALANEENTQLAARVGAVALVAKDGGFLPLRAALEGIRAGG